MAADGFQLQYSRRKTRFLAIYLAKIIKSAVFITLEKNRLLGLHHQWLFIMQMRVLGRDRRAVKLDRCKLLVFRQIVHELLSLGEKVRASYTRITPYLYFVTLT